MLALGVLRKVHFGERQLQPALGADVGWWGRQHPSIVARGCYESVHRMPAGAEAKLVKVPLVAASELRHVILDCVSNRSCSRFLAQLFWI